MRDLPKVDVLAKDPRLLHFPTAIRTRAAREAIDLARNLFLTGSSPDPLELAVSIAERLIAPGFPQVINLSGVILHTGLGRARLAEEARAAMMTVAEGHSAIEFDLEEGKRGDRQSHVRILLTELTGAEDALVVNNAAGALLLACAATAAGREIVLSRGQMVEIGGSFRVPDVVTASGTRIREVGTTNRTSVTDFEFAISEETGAILRCHPSNYRVEGYVSEPSRQELATLAHAYGLPFIDDMGTGLLVDLGIKSLVTMGNCVSSGADIVIGSGDKLLGGPQAGIIVGTRDMIGTLAEHPIARAVRIDKLSLAALHATLMLYRRGEASRIPTIRYIRRPVEQVKASALRLASASRGEVVETESELGAGSGGCAGIPSYAATVPGDAEETARRLRARAPSIIGRVKKGTFLLDPRTLEEAEEPIVLQALKEL